MREGPRQTTIAFVEDEGTHLGTLVMQSLLIRRREGCDLAVFPILVNTERYATEVDKYHAVFAEAKEFGEEFDQVPTPKPVASPAADIATSLFKLAPNLLFVDSWLGGDDPLAGVRVLVDLQRQLPDAESWLMTMHVDTVAREMFLAHGLHWEHKLDKSPLTAVAIGSVSPLLEQQVRNAVAMNTRVSGGLGAIVGQSDVMLGLFGEVRNHARHSQPVYIGGETGSGKELVARELHLLSRCSKGPFVPVNCGRLDRERAEGELFGWVRGAFTDARSNKRGYLREANGGTLLLDEVAELDHSVQIKLNRVLDDMRVRPVGGEAADEKTVKVRVLTATNEDLSSAVEKGRFREDLYYRLCNHQIKVPPLRARADDIPLLIQSFIRETLGPQTKVALTPEAMQACVEYEWPGNVRQLEQLISGIAERLPAHAKSIGVDQVTSSLKRPSQRKVSNAEQIWNSILLEGRSEPLSDLSKMHGVPLTVEVAKMAIAYCGSQKDACLYFQMSANAFRAWVFRNRK